MTMTHRETKPSLNVGDVVYYKPISEFDRMPWLTLDERYEDYIEYSVDEGDDDPPGISIPYDTTKGYVITEIVEPSFSEYIYYVVDHGEPRGQQWVEIWALHDPARNITELLTRMEVGYYDIY